MTASELGANGGKPFAERLKETLADRECSQRGLAKAIGASKQSVTNWTQGRNEPSPRNMRGIARALDIPLANLVEDRPRELDTGSSDATALLRELVGLPIEPAVRSLSRSAPDFLELLSRAERHLRDADAEPG